MVSSSQKESSHTVEECPGRGTLHGPSSLQGEKYMDITSKSSRGLASQRLPGRGERSGHSRSGQFTNIKHSKAQCSPLRTDLSSITKDRSGSERSIKRMICSSRIMLAMLAMFSIVAKGSISEYSHDEVEKILAEIAQTSTCPKSISNTCNRAESIYCSMGTGYYFYGKWKCKTGAVASIKNTIDKGFKAHFTLRGSEPSPLVNPILATYTPHDDPVMFLQQDNGWWIVMPFQDKDDPQNSEHIKLAWYTTIIKEKRFFVYCPKPVKQSRRAIQRIATAAEQQRRDFHNAVMERALSDTTSIGRSDQEENSKAGAPNAAGSEASVTHGDTTDTSTGDEIDTDCNATRRQDQKEVGSWFCTHKGCKGRASYWIDVENNIVDRKCRNGKIWATRNWASQTHCYRCKAKRPDECYVITNVIEQQYAVDKYYGDKIIKADVELKQSSC